MNAPQYVLEGVYYLDPSQNQGMNPIAIRPKIQPNYISWEDTSYGRSVSYSSLYFDGKEIKAPLSRPKTLPKVIDVYEKSEKNTPPKHFHLVVLTSQIFEDKLKTTVSRHESLKEFSTDQQVQQHYLKENFGQ